MITRNLIKCILSLHIATLLGIVPAPAAVVEDFESYEPGLLTPQATIWTERLSGYQGEQSRWSVAADPEDPKNKVLEMTGGISTLRYTGEESFIGSGTGYTMFAKIWFHTKEGAEATGMGVFRSGLLIDQMDDNPTSSNARHLELGWAKMKVLVANEEGKEDARLGTGGLKPDMWNYVRIYRSGMDAATNQGGELQVFMSETPFTEGDEGKLIFDSNMLSEPLPETDRFASSGKFGFWAYLTDPQNEKVYYDDIAVFPGNVPAIPPPATTSAPGPKSGKSKPRRSN